MERSSRLGATYVLLALLLLAVLTASVFFGAVSITGGEVVSAIGKGLGGKAPLSLNERILLQIRLPRTLLCALTGAALSIGGVLLQALFRNPVVEPGLVGTSSGAAFGASLYFVLGSVFGFSAGVLTLPLAAFGGALLSTSLVLLLAADKRDGKNSIVLLLLVGIAINALFFSGVGFLSYIARDPQARSITFWSLGTFSGASWLSVATVGAVFAVCLIAALRCARQLNALGLGEEAARALGVEVNRLRLQVLGINLVLVATATAFCGVIGFVGLVVPHLLRLFHGTENRYLLLAGALTGASLLGAADLLARLLLRPAELPIGIVTSLVGVPVFIVLLKRKIAPFR